MKKTLALLLALVMCLSLCACGGNDSSETKSGVPEVNTTETTSNNLLDSREEILASIELGVEFDSLHNTTLENRAKAQLEYCGKPIMVYGQVYQIESDCIIMGFIPDVTIKVELSLEELASLTIGDWIILGGVLGEAEEGTSYGLPTYQYTMNPGYVYDYETEAKPHF